MTFLWATIFVLGVLIFVHELGHFIAARSVGVRVDRFSIGFPPRFISITSIPDGWNFRIYFYKNEGGKLVWGPVFESQIQRPGRTDSGTEYVLALIPLGGYVKMAGMIDESLDTHITYAPDEFMSKPTWAKIYVLCAGVIMNLITAFIIFSGIAYVQGTADILDEPVVSELRADMPAQEAGILPGDRITAIDGSAINTWKELTNVIHNIPNTPISLTIVRDESKFELSLTTSYMILPNSGRIDTLGAIGIVPQIIYSDILWNEALNAGVLATFNTVGMIVMSLHMLFTGVASVADLGGPIMIAQLAGQTANEGWIPLLSFMALISVNLAFLNIFPIPGLDGGHIFILLIESVIRRPLTLRARMVIQQIGMTFLLILMVTVVFNDITRLFN
tara:strand:- start:893 stop:2062 length:1170 start_codon:yes stop_codon:yes gene_type:complete